MALNSINTNVAAYFAQSNINKAGDASASAIGRLSSGSRIVQASDDVAGLAAGTSLQTTVTTLRAALTNASQGSSLLQVADGALAEITDILQRQKSLAVQAGSGSLTDVERGFLDQEFQALSAEIDRLAETTSFNGVGLLSGSGLSLNLASTDTIAATFDPTGADANTGTTVASQFAIEAFDIAGNATANGAAPTAGQLSFVQADNTTELADGEYLAVNPNVYGTIDDISVSAVQPTIGGTLEVEINGITFTGAFADGDTNVVVSNGNTRIDIGTAALDTTDETTIELAVATSLEAFTNVRIQRTSNVSGINFSGTRLDGVIGDAALGGIAAVRLSSGAENVQINNFAYVGNDGTNSTFSVQVNGETFVANAVADGLAADEIMTFEDGAGQALVINFTGLELDFATGANNEDNFRQDVGTRQAFVDALNIGFARGGAGLDFAVGETSADSLNVNIDSVTTSFLYGGQALSLSSAATATTASDQLDFALDYVTAVRADVGAVQSRFNFASANVESAIQNQDAARAVFLDTDVATESTAFATSQVQLQAGISVLAQANLQAQNLLKLIG